MATKNRTFVKNTMASRIHRRMLALGIERVKELERKCGFVNKKTGNTTNMISDLFEGKKNTINSKSLPRIAKELQTNVTWLISGVGNETTIESDKNHFLSMFHISSKNIINVEKSRRARIYILRLDPNTGECAFYFHNDIAPTTRVGVIIDPEIYMNENIYIEGIKNRSELAVMIKIAKMNDGPDAAFIIDSNK